MPVSVDKSRLDEFSANKRAARGKHAVIVTDARRHTPAKEDNHDIMIRFQYKIMGDPEDGNSAKGFPITTWVTTLLDNGDFADHRAPQRAAQDSCTLLGALYPEDCAPWPRWDKDTGMLMYKGQPINKIDEKLMRKEANSAAMDKYLEIYGDEGEMLHTVVGRMMYVDLDYDKESGLPRFKECHAELPDDWELSTEYIELDVDDLAETAEEVTAPKKKAKKKTTRRRRG